jgi:hypothetical protein
MKESGAVTAPDCTPGKSFDDMARVVAGAKPSRRRLLGLLGACLGGGTLALPGDAEGRRGRRTGWGRLFGYLVLPPPAPPGAVTTCRNLTTPCGLGGGPLACRCRFSKEAQQLCLNVLEPPDEVAFASCQLSINCPTGQVCDAEGSVCRFPCQTA